MDLVPLMLFAIAVVGWGAAATVLLTKWIPHPVAQLASQHGRFVGVAERGGGVARASYRAHVQAEAMNVVGTSN